MRRLLAAALVLTLGAAGSVAAAPAPKMAITDFAQLATPLPYPYDEQADADALVAKAKAKARAEHKLLLIDLGGNWCPDCRILAATMDRPELKAFVEKHYVEVTVDVGRFNKNLQIPAHYGINKRLEGVPALLVVDPRSDKLLNASKVSALSDARHMSPQGLADYLAQWPK